MTRTHTGAKALEAIVHGGAVFLLPNGGEATGVCKGEMEKRTAARAPIYRPGGGSVGSARSRRRDPPRDPRKLLRTNGMTGGVMGAVTDFNPATP